MLSLKNIDRICVVLILIIALAGSYWVTGQITKQKRILRKENEILSKRVKDMNLAEANLKQIRTILNNARRELQILNERIPEKAETGAFINQLDKMFKQREIVLTGLIPLKPVKEKLYTRIPFRLNFKGPFNNIYRLLKDMESMNRILVVENMSISKGIGSQEGTVDLTANVFERGV